MKTTIFLTAGWIFTAPSLSVFLDAGGGFGIVGPNGAGKTTTVECLIGLRKPDGGEIRARGPGRSATASASNSSRPLSPAAVLSSLLAVNLAFSILGAAVLAAVTVECAVLAVCALMAGRFTDKGLNELMSILSNRLTKCGNHLNVASWISLICSQ